MLTNEDIKALDWEKTGGLIPAVVQDATSREVLMLAWMNDEALSRTLTTRLVALLTPQAMPLKVCTTPLGLPVVPEV